MSNSQAHATAMHSNQMSHQFIDRLIDWKDFERFVHDMYAEDERLEVQHNVTVKGKSGARRQIDVRVTHHVNDHTNITVVECKRWKKPVTRERIDILAATIEDTDAAKGVMFTTSGYETGAQEYAKAKNIDLFLVRDLTDQEWGLPGRIVWMHLQFYTAEIHDVKPETVLLATVPDPPTNFALDIHIRPDGQQDPALTLHDATDASAGPNLLAVLHQARHAALTRLASQLGLLDDGTDATRSLIIPLQIELAGAKHRDLHHSFGMLRLERLQAELHVLVGQSRVEVDRGRQLDLALAVENYLTRKRRVVTRPARGEVLTVGELPESQPPVPDDDPLNNGSLLQIFTEPWVTFEKPLENPQRLGTLTVNVHTDTRATPG
jgi:hypothetical protein